MKDIFATATATAKEYGDPEDLELGATSRDSLNSGRHDSSGRSVLNKTHRIRLLCRSDKIRTHVFIITTRWHKADEVTSQKLLNSHLISRLRRQLPSQGKPKTKKSTILL
jgi:hypothetical protein